MRREYRRDWKIRMVVLVRERNELYSLIEKRVDLFLQKGWIDETEAVLKKYGDPKIPAFESVGYSHIVDYLMGEVDFETMRERICVDTRRYAKRQITFAKQFPNALVLNLGDWEEAFDRCLRGMKEDGW